jgi:hypothetical protein
LESPVFEFARELACAANTIEEMQKLLLGYRDNMRVEVETGIAVTQKPWRTSARYPLGRTASM